jgi:hypothetical protein
VGKVRLKESCGLEPRTNFFPFKKSPKTECGLDSRTYSNLVGGYQSSGENYCLQKSDTTQSSMDSIINLVALVHLPRDNVTLALFHVTSTYKWVLKKNLLIMNQHIIDGTLTCYLVPTSNFPGCCFRLHKNIIWKWEVKLKILPTTYQANK